MPLLRYDRANDQPNRVVHAVDAFPLAACTQSSPESERCQFSYLYSHAALHSSRATPVKNGRHSAILYQE